MNPVSSNNPGHPMTVMVFDDTISKYRPLRGDDFQQSRQSNSVAADPTQYQSSPSNFSVNTAAGTLYTLAAGEKGFIQNLGMVPIFVKKGTGCTVNSFSFILKAGSTMDDGTGGIVVLNDWMGEISICATSNSNLRYIAWKMTT